ncbi:MAG: helix-turn-helix domain-containing protein [Nitrospiraceae bacterium]|nr:helix-turn-helix domain-containing protein [Nitrospiraceae bacterium]
MKQASFPGEQLRQRREELGLSVYEAFRNSRVPAQHIEALENGQIEALPGECYAIGFLKSYCDFLQIDPAPFVDSYHEYSRPPVTRFLRRQRSTPDTGMPLWMRDVATWAAITAIVALGWLTYTVIFKPQSNTPETRVEAGTVEMVVPPVPGERGF